MRIQAWGWRVPFLLSLTLIIIGYLVRRAVEESPVFKELQQRTKTSSAPLRDLFRSNTRNVVLTALISVANNAAGYLLIAYFISYGTTTLGLARPSVLLATVAGAVGWLVFTMYGGMLSDRIGRVRTFQIGYALGAILGGAFAPTIAQALVQSTGSALSVGAYIMVPGSCGAAMRRVPLRKSSQDACPAGRPSIEVSEVIESSIRRT
ncbi:hypothetical protein Psi01_81760 [Planobispora siamensis]|uniref:Major facilitator superfamily (MFS) profile domain-containing protein n=1 Tax=Planobispora siamensis TaxID=936338 RepID=A0A8J3WS50_9ACTN|nr:hypothetical protein Psi01_81760 [Planobispora siamensis]